VQGESTCDVDALTLTAAELVRITPQGRAVQADGVQQFCEARRKAFCRRFVVDGEGFGEDLLDGHTRIECGVGILKDDLHASAHCAHGRAGGGRKRLAFEEDFACGGFDEAQQDAGDGCLAAARFSDQTKRFAWLDSERYIVDDARYTVVARVFLDETADFNQRRLYSAWLRCGIAGKLVHRRNGSIPMVLQC